jgi:hypothetical protein
MQVTYAGHICRLHMQVTYAGYICSRLHMQVTYAGYICRLHMPVTYAAGYICRLTYAGFICRLHVQVTYAGYICLLHALVTYAGYICRLYMQVTYAGYICRLHMQVTYAGYICRLHMQVTYAGYMCRLHMQVTYARLHRGGIRWSRGHGANYRRDYNPVVWIVDEADPHVHLSCAALLVSCGGDLTATAATLVNLGKGESPAAKTVLAEIWPPLPRPHLKLGTLHRAEVLALLRLGHLPHVEMGSIAVWRVAHSV